MTEHQDAGSQQNEAGKFEQQRTEKVSKIKQLGIDPYGGRFDNAESTESIRKKFHEQNPSAAAGEISHEGGPVIRAACAGRIVLLRDIGKLIFITLRDRTGTIQIGLSKKLLESQWNIIKMVELGDIVGVKGQLGLTKTGELTIWVEDFTLLTKSVLQPPEKFHGLSDTELRYRQRYVDLWANPEVMQKFRKRIDMISTIRSFLCERGFLEVETPMMQTIAGGAAAKPFITHHNALDIDLYLRIAPELFLKRLLVGGMEKVFEINRNFRNEGLSPRHNPEFTMMEIYQAYADYNIMMELTESLISTLIEKHCEGTKLKFGEHEVDFAKPWRRAPYSDLFKQYCLCDIHDIAAVRKQAKAAGIDESQMDDDVVVNKLFEEKVEGNLVNPTFVIDYPGKLCPLTKRSKTNPELAERFELYIGCIEIANAYTELNDPAVQLENFSQQVKGAGEDEETFRSLDEDFITALKYGMPPAGGLGIGIDRLVMLLTGTTNIRDVILFPLLKPEKI